MATLSSTRRYIYITPTFKVLNPANQIISPLYRYHGEISGYDFKNQKKNLEDIQKKLAPMNAELTTIYVGKFMGDKRQKTHFIAHNDAKTVWWRKYDEKREGGSKNLIYLSWGRTTRGGTVRSVQMTKSFELKRENMFSLSPLTPLPNAERGCEGSRKNAGGERGCEGCEGSKGDKGCEDSRDSKGYEGCEGPIIVMKYKCFIKGDLLRE